LGHIKVVEALIEKGADMNATEQGKDRYIRDVNHYGGRTALIWAAMNGHTAVVEALIEKGAGMNATEKSYYEDGSVSVADDCGHGQYLRAYTCLFGTTSNLCQVSHTTSFNKFP
jgi:ankyrin repeat protein